MTNIQDFKVVGTPTVFDKDIKKDVSINIHKWKENDSIYCAASITIDGKIQKLGEVRFNVLIGGVVTLGHGHKITCMKKNHVWVKELD